MTLPMPTQIHCPTCQSENVIFSKKRGAYVCEDCGHLLPEKPVDPMRIFLSYGHDANEELVRRIKNDLEKRGHDVWFDKNPEKEKGIRPGQDWRRAITDGILKSNNVLSFLSKHSTRDPGVCRDEVDIAIGVKGGNIQTILVESEQEVSPPENVKHIQWVDMHDWKTGRGIVRLTKDEPAVGDPPWEQWYQEKLDEIIAVVESDESRCYAAEIESLAKVLKPVVSDFTADSRVLQLLEKELVGRQWMFEAIEQWRSAVDRKHRLFWIKGSPGVGKSAFVAHLAHSYGRGRVIAVHFCDWQKPDYRDADRIVRTLAFQIAARLPDYRKLLLTKPDISDLDRQNPSELFKFLLTDPLRNLIGGGRERNLILIDALDEAATAERNPLVELLASDAEKLPDWIGLVVTSRPDSNVTAPLQGLNPFPFETSSEKNLDDLRDYLRLQLAPQLEHRPDADRLVEQILEKSEGVFLYVERFCDEVQHGHLSLDHPEQFPQCLGGIFCQWFQRQFPDLEKFRKDVRPALRAILAAREPLPVEILHRLFHWQDEELRDFTRNLGSLFPVTKEANGEVIKPYHKSVADWLANEASSGVFFVSVIEGHRTLAGFLLERLGIAKLASSQPAGGSILDYAIRHVAEHCLTLGRLTNDFSLFFHNITPGYVFERANEGNLAQAVSDNACCLQALGEQKQAAIPVRQLGHALLACLLQEIGEDRFRTGVFLLDCVERRDYSVTASPLEVRAGLQLLLAEAALDAGDSRTAAKLVDEACSLPMSCWSGIDVTPFQAQAGANLPPDSPLLTNVTGHPLVAYLSRLATQMPEAAYQIAKRVRPKRAELPNLATLWLAILDAVPAEADFPAMERLFTFTDRHVLDLCETDADYREFMDRYLAAAFRNKDRFSPQFSANAVLQSTQTMMTHLREAFGEEWAFVRLLRCMALLLRPASTVSGMAEIYRECAVNAVKALETLLFQEGKKVPIKVLAYYLRLRFECGLTVDPELLRGAVSYAFSGLTQERAHPLRFIEPIRVLHSVSPAVVREIALENNFQLREHADENEAAPLSDAPATEATKRIGIVMTSNPNNAGLASAVTTGSRAENLMSDMHRSRGMSDFQTIMIVDPLAAEMKPARLEPQGSTTNAFEWNRSILVSLREGMTADEVRKQRLHVGQTQWRSHWKQYVEVFLLHLLTQGATHYGEAGRVLLQKVLASPNAADLHLQKMLIEGLMAMGEAQSRRALTDQQFADLREAAQDLLKRGSSYGLTMLAWAALSRPDQIVETVNRMKAEKEQWLFWLILFRECDSIPESLSKVGLSRLLHLASDVATEDQFQIGMETLLVVVDSPIWKEIWQLLDTAYNTFPSKSAISQRLCRTLLQAPPKVLRHRRYYEVLEAHLERIQAHWFEDNDQDSEGEKDLNEAMRGVTTAFVRHAMSLSKSLAPVFQNIARTHDPEGKWHMERALLFPEELSRCIQNICESIENDRRFVDQLPEGMGGVLGGFLDSFARAVSPNRDPLGQRLSSQFADLAELGSRFSDRHIDASMQTLLSELPASAVATIAVGIISRVLEIDALETARKWLKSSGGILASAIEDWEDLIPETRAGVEFVMDMIAVDGAPEIVSNSVRVFASVCIESGQESAVRSVEEALGLFDLAGK